MINILIADDSIVNRKLLEAFLENEDDIKIFQAENGKEALVIVKNNPIDIIFMDIEMPKLDGIEATKKVKMIKPSTIVVLITSYSNERYIQIATKIGAEGYIVKPINRDLFLYKFNPSRIKIISLFIFIIFALFKLFPILGIATTAIIERIDIAKIISNSEKDFNFI